MQVTRNGGATWRKVGKNLPGLPQKDLWVSRVEASHHTRGTGYVSVDGHRDGELQAVRVQDDRLRQDVDERSRGNLPDDDPVYVVKEDLKNPNLLFAGTEFAVFYSLDGGKKWSKLNNNMPTVAVHDLMIHPRDNDLIAATHGRGIWIMDDITPLQQLTDKVTSGGGAPVPEPAGDAVAAHPAARHGGTLGFRGENPTRNAVINYHLSAAVDRRREVRDLRTSPARRSAR